MESFHSYSKEKKIEVLNRLFKFQNGKCFLCDGEIEELTLDNIEEFLKKYEVDHIKPLA